MKENYLKKELYNLIKEESYIFDFIQSAALDGIWYWDLENPEQEWMSPQFWQTLGYDYTDKEHLVKEWQDIIFKKDLEKSIKNLNKHIEDPTYPYDQVVRYKHKSGETVWIRCRGLAIRDEEGKAIRIVGAHIDITELKEAQQEISELSEEYEKVFNGTQDAMFLMEVLEDGGFKFIRNNETHQNKTGISLSQIRNKTPQDLLGKELGDIVSKNYKKCLDKKESISYEEELHLPGGKRIWLTTLTPILENGKVMNIVGSSTDITERKKLEDRLEKYANFDKLTELPNRRLFFRKIEEVLYESERYQNKFALLFLDLDGFKFINDNFGHKIGDEVLIRVANRLKHTIRKSDFVARMGGDEFTILLKNIENKDFIEEIVKKVQNKLREKIEIDDITCTVDSSLGISIYPKDGKDTETLLKHSDCSMYEVKKNGKAGYNFFNELDITVCSE